MSTRWIWIGAGAGMGGALALAAALLLAPVTPQVPLEPTRDGQMATADRDDLGMTKRRDAVPQRRAAKRGSRAARAEGVDREEIKEQRRLRREERAKEREPLLESEERAEARKMYREDRLLEVNERLDEVSVDRDWDPELTEEVRLVLVDTADRITQALTRVAGDKEDWDQVKSELREYRLKQAADLEDLLGPDEFDAFVEGMAFERFSAGPPVRGRLEAPRSVSGAEGR